MAIDPQLLQLLFGGGVGNLPSTPISGIGGGTPLSGLMLGEQGMGLDGGGGMLAGQGGGAGGAMGGGVGDLSQLMAMLQGAGGAGEIGPGGGAPTLGQGGGGALGAGFGAGGFLQPQQMGVPQGTVAAGLGGGINMAQILSLAKTLGRAFLPTGAVPSIGETTLPAVGGAFAEPVGTTLEQIQAAQPGFFSLTGEGMGGPLDPQRFSLGVSPNFDLGSLGAGATQAFQGAPPAGQIMEGVGGGGAAPSAPSGVAPFGGFGFNLPTIGGLTGIGTGAFELSRGNPIGVADVTAGLGSLAFPPAAPLFAGFSLLAHLLGGEDRPSTFKPMREAAARSGEASMSTRQQLIDQALQSRDPALALQALQWVSGDNPWPGVSGIGATGVPRNPVRSDVSMSPDLARQLGFNPTQDIQRYLGAKSSPYMIRGGPGWIDSGVARFMQGLPKGLTWGDISSAFQAPLAASGLRPPPPVPYGLYRQGPGRAEWERLPGTVSPEGTTYTPDVFSAGWGDFNPNQFSQFLNMYKQDPTPFNITGSGDVAYLQQGPAEALAARARQQTIDLLNQSTQWPQFA